MDEAGQARGCGHVKSDRLAGWEDVISQLDGVIRAQELKVLALGREIHPGLTSEDARNPQDFKAVRRSPEFNYEDGILAGLLSARVCLTRELAERRAAASTEQPSD